MPYYTGSLRGHWKDDAEKTFIVYFVIQGKQVEVPEKFIVRLKQMWKRHVKEVNCPKIGVRVQECLWSSLPENQEFPEVLSSVKVDKDDELNKFVATYLLVDELKEIKKSQIAEAINRFKLMKDV